MRGFSSNVTHSSPSSIIKHTKSTPISSYNKSQSQFSFPSQLTSQKSSFHSHRTQFLKNSNSKPNSLLSASPRLHPTQKRGYPYSRDNRFDREFQEEERHNETIHNTIYQTLKRFLDEYPSLPFYFHTREEFNWIRMHLKKHATAPFSPSFRKHRFRVDEEATPDYIDARDLEPIITRKNPENYLLIDVRNDTSLGTIPAAKHMPFKHESVFGPEIHQVFEQVRDDPKIRHVIFFDEDGESESRQALSMFYELWVNHNIPENTDPPELAPEKEEAVKKLCEVAERFEEERREMFAGVSVSVDSLTLYSDLKTELYEDQIQPYFQQMEEESLELIDRVQNLKGDFYDALEDVIRTATPEDYKELPPKLHPEQVFHRFLLEAPQFDGEFYRKLNMSTLVGGYLRWGSTFRAQPSLVQNPDSQTFFRLFK
eukprot:gb/GECH01000535.1/.p1 GENE.gb/GECH01000535.1/~~gb/GECH01000535.1/.p1  ORF type:complete len:427 (+),score=110.23 gb/GECH01000535.1/:1-1281(+)